MGPVKAALEASARYLAYELGPQGHPRAPDLAGAAEDPRGARASRTSTCCSTKRRSVRRSAKLVDIMDVGFTCAFLATPYARRLTGETLYVDGGVHIMA